MRLFGLFGKKTKSHTEERKSVKDIEVSYEEIISLIDKYVKDESKEIQKSQVKKQNEIISSHRCSIHNKPIQYAFTIKGATVELSITNKCCKQSLLKLTKKL